MITITIPLYTIIYSIPTTLLAAIFCIGAGLIFFAGGKLCNGIIQDCGINNPFYIGGLMLIALGLIFIGAFIGDSIIASMPQLPTIIFPIRFEVV